MVLGKDASNESVRGINEWANLEENSGKKDIDGYTKEKETEDDGARVEANKYKHQKSGYVL